MKAISHHYDREADVLYLSFGKSEHVFTVELSEHLLLRLDLGKESNTAPRAIGMTLLFPAALLKQGHNPLTLQFDRFRHLPAETKSAIIEVLAGPPVSEVLSAQLQFTAAAPALPQLLAA